VLLPLVNGPRAGRIVGASPSPPSLRLLLLRLLLLPLLLLPL
jgi:hypothetical protein